MFQFGPEQISLWSKLLGKTEEDYFQETLKMLTSTAESSASYTLDKSSFTWKKKVDGDLKIKFGSIALESVSYCLLINHTFLQSMPLCGAIVHINIDSETAKMCVSFAAFQNLCFHFMSSKGTHNISQNILHLERKNNRSF